MASLYEINEKLAMYEMQFDESTGEWLNEDELTALQMEKDEKRENIALYIKNLEAEANAVKAESKNLDERYKRLINKATRLHGYLEADLNGEPFKTSRVECRWRKSEAVKILNEDAVPERFMDIQVVRKPVKNEIKKYLKGLEGSDEEVPWATLEKKNNLQLK